MKSLIVSYVSGVPGDFTCSLISSGGSQYVDTLPVTVTPTNRYIYPNYLAPIGKNMKVYFLPQWPITEADINTLNSIYGEQEIVIPTYWYSKSVSNTNLPATGLRLYVGTQEGVKLALTLWAIYSKDLPIWPERVQEIQAMIDAGHPYSAQLAELLEPGKYENWVFAAYKKNALLNGVPNLKYFLRLEFLNYLRYNYTDYLLPEDWFLFDVEKMIYGDQSNIPELEQFLNITIDRDKITAYKEANLLALKQISDIDLVDFEGESWLEKLVNFLEPISQP